MVKNPQDGSQRPYFWVISLTAATVGGITVCDLTTPIAA
jgi:hypothetical protein